MKISEKMNNASGAECKAVCTEAGEYLLCSVVLCFIVLMYMFYVYVF